VRRASESAARREYGRASRPRRAVVLFGFKTGEPLQRGDRPERLGETPRPTSEPGRRAPPVLSGSAGRLALPHPRHRGSGGSADV